jgi:YggT family protein
VIVTVFYVVRIFFQILIWSLIAVAILSWIVPMMRGRPDNLFVRLYAFLYRVTEPLTRPAKALLSRFNTGPIDFSLMVTVLFLIVIEEVLMRILFAVMV